MQRQSKYESEQQSLAESLNSAQRKANDERTRVTELSSQLKTAKSQVDEVRKELNDYKEKASRILQVKLNEPFVILTFLFSFIPEIMYNAFVYIAV